MLRKLNTSLNIIAGSFVGVFIGNAAYVFWDYRAHSDLYVMYTSILVHGIVTIVVLLVVVMIKLIILRKSKEQNL